MATDAYVEYVSRCDNNFTSLLGYNTKNRIDRILNGSNCCRGCVNVSSLPGNSAICLVCHAKSSELVIWFKIFLYSYMLFNKLMILRTRDLNMPCAISREMLDGLTYFI